MDNAKLEDFASLIRSVGSECTLLTICEGMLIAGSRDGSIVCWDIKEGEEVWKISVDGPCISCDTNDKSLFFTESDKIHSIDLKTGEMVWSIDIEGSGDLMSLSGGLLWVTSSVYNFELQDYVEGTVWRIGIEGTISGKWEIDGRAWSLTSRQECATMGLSRPRCGLAVISKDKDLTYQNLENLSPVTVGKVAESGSIFLGHSNGGISEISESGSSNYAFGSSTVRAIEEKEGLVVGMDSGAIIAKNGTGSWEVMTVGSVDWISIGPSSGEEEWLWTSSWSVDSVVSLIEISSGSIELELCHQHRVGVCYSSNDLIALGDSFGGVFLFEKDVLSRRIGRAQEIGSRTENDALLRRKIRNLRR